jgi:nucleotide-binding universal stress UspA family protein
MIVVGIDGSEDSTRALWFAADEAAARNRGLRIVSAWQTGVPVYAGGLIAPAPIAPSEMEEETREAAEHQAQDVLDQHPGLRSEIVVRQGGPAAVLVEESADADMLVVGSRGLGGFAGLLLGSVSQQCAHHALCPVVILPPADRS